MTPLLLPPPSMPMKVAARFMEDEYRNPGYDRDLLIHSRNTFYVWDDKAWPDAEDRSLRSALYDYLSDAIYEKVTKDGVEECEWAPNRHKVDDVLDALKAVGHLARDVNPPTWLNGADPVPAAEVIVVDNGLLHVPTRRLLAHRPDFWTHNSLPYSYDSGAKPPKRWITFLHELWDDDIESILCLQEIFGYVLSIDTRQQKIFLIVGPPRSGKGTIARVMAGLLGEHNRTAVTLAGMATNFGLQDLIDKPLAIISDARLSGKADGQIVVERLLSISGEDAITIDRKYRDHWTGKLPTRFLVLTNELPRFTDSSGALASRFIILTLTRSWLGSEDETLTDTLLGEATGIFNWALEGLDRLQQRGHFEPPSSSQEAITELQDLASPVSAFLRECCQVGSQHEVLTDGLYRAWRLWATDQGHTRITTAATFGRDLRAAQPTIRKIRPRDEDERRQHYYQGVGLNGQWTVTVTSRDQHAKSAVVTDGHGDPQLSPERDLEPCPRCGTPIPGDARTCFKCGGDIDQETSRIY